MTDPPRNTPSAPSPGGRPLSVAGSSPIVWPTDRHVERTLRCVLGLVVFGAGLSLIIRAELGLAPWDVFHQGVADRVGLGIGTVIILTGLTLMLLWIPLRERPGLGTILNATVIGLTVGLTLPWTPEVEPLLLRAVFLALGVTMVAAGSGAYIGAGLGPGPRDGLMTGLARRGLSIRVARTGVEASVLVLGLLLGGPVGVGTAVFAFGIGPLVQVFLPRMTVPAAPRH